MFLIPQISGHDSVRLKKKIQNGTRNLQSRVTFDCNQSTEDCLDHVLFSSNNMFRNLNKYRHLKII